MLTACPGSHPLLPLQSGTSKLLTANSGDARILLVRGNQAIQLTEDHVPGQQAMLRVLACRLLLLHSWWHCRPGQPAG